MVVIKTGRTRRQGAWENGDEALEHAVVNRLAGQGSSRKVNFHSFHPDGFLAAGEFAFYAFERIGKEHRVQINERNVPGSGQKVE